MEFFLVRIFPPLDWIWRDTSYLSIFSPNVGKYGPEKTPYLDTFHTVIIAAPSNYLDTANSEFFIDLPNLNQDNILGIFNNSYAALAYHRQSSRSPKQSLLIFFNIDRKTPMLESFLNKVTSFRTYNFTKKRLLHRCFAVNTAKLGYLRWLLLHWQSSILQSNEKIHYK